MWNDFKWDDLDVYAGLALVAVTYACFWATIAGIK